MGFFLNHARLRQASSVLFYFMLQVIGEGMGDAFLRLRLKDQQKAMDMITSDEQLKGLQLVRAPLIDLEVRGIPALQYFGGVVWQDTLPNFAQGG